MITDPLASGRLHMGRPRDWIIGATLLLALVVAVWMTVGWGPLLAPWRELSPLLLAGLFALLALSYVLRALRVYDYLHPRLAGRFPALLRLTILHNTANNLMPMRTGELVFPWLMRRYFGHGFFDSAAALLWIRVLDLHFIVLIGLFIVALRHPAWIWWAAGGLWVAALALLVPFGRVLGGVVAAPASGLIARARQLALRVLTAAPRDPLIIARVYLWTALTWILKFIAFAGVLQHFLPVELWRVMTGVMGAELSSVLPVHGIAGSGSYELAVVAALAPFGVDPKMALIGAVNLHLFVLGSTLLIGVLAVLLPRQSRHDSVQADRSSGAAIKTHADRRD
ncbi:MAG: flippase-like domain-containing protein [Sphingobacteriia bacterium]|nr:flippase-like domain-containing protein [Sphingobacteriia bacterium]NCC40842.1 flippase-like domain-containing protein [Gammaproteobacteria bacterium]